MAFVTGKIGEEFSMDVFEAFPNSVKTDWTIGKVQRATEIGDVYTELGHLACIVERGTTAEFNTSPSAQITRATTLLFVKPETLPTTDVETLKASYIVSDGQSRRYDIVDAAEGFNQETGELEHIELSLNPTGVVA